MPELSPSTVALISAIAFAFGAAISPMLARIILFLAEDRSIRKTIGCLHCDRSDGWVRSLRGGRCECGTARPRWPMVLSIGTATLFAVFAALYFGLNCQETPDVRPVDLWYYGRFASHLLLLTLLVIIIGTDLWNYSISDIPIVFGIVVALSLAVVSGDLQIVHIWVDWNQEIPGFRGPYRPDWLSEHPHLHGLAWSVTGMAVGAGLTWLLRVTAEFLLQKPALGLGDVTLMAMIGSFVGWQVVILIMLLAPLLAIVVGVAVWAITGRAFVAYGPYLALSAIVLLCSWRWVWMTDLRLLFGHARSLMILAAAAGGALLLLLGALRLYQFIPATRDNT